MPRSLETWRLYLLDRMVPIATAKQRWLPLSPWNTVVYLGRGYKANRVEQATAGMMVAGHLPVEQDIQQEY